MEKKSSVGLNVVGVFLIIYGLLAFVCVFPVVSRFGEVYDAHSIPTASAIWASYSSNEKIAHVLSEISSVIFRIAPFLILFGSIGVLMRRYGIALSSLLGIFLQVIGFILLLIGSKLDPSAGLLFVQIALIYPIIFIGFVVFFNHPKIKEKFK